MSRFVAALGLLFLPLETASISSAQKVSLTFERRHLTTDFFCEGASYADLDSDGHGDVIAGPYWYAGPEYAQKRLLYEAKPFDPLQYSDNFFAFPHDFDADGWMDVLVVGFPGKEAYWLENPGESIRDEGARWERHLAFAKVDGEAPLFDDLTGDGKPELVFHTAGDFGWAEPDWSAPREPWTFHPLSREIGLPQFTHGLGIGDLNGDGRADLIEKSGWWEHPPSLEGDPPWQRRAFPFAGFGGAQMLVYDVDGDGDTDLITSLNGHGFGLSWYEQVEDPESITFTEHEILGKRARSGPGGFNFSQLHAVDLADVDGDGLLDIVTGKRFWAHGPEGDPEPNEPAYLVWFRLERHERGRVLWRLHVIDDDSGVGTQVVAGDVNGDGRTDVVVGNKKGTFVHLQGPRPKEEHDAEDADDTEPPGESDEEGSDDSGLLPSDDSGRSLNLDFETGDLSDWTAAGQAFEDQPVRGDTVSARGREPSLHLGEYWIGGYESLGDEPTGTLTSVAFEVVAPWASFLVGGGAYDATRVELFEEGAQESFFRTSAMDFESMQRVVVDLRERRGTRIFVRLTDENSGGWGHVNFDDFRFHAKRPSFELPAWVPQLLPYDSVEHSGLSPDAAALVMDVPDGFQVELVAGEPDVHQPIALTLDAKGRLWVAEAHSYPTRRPDGEGRDRILVFEDEDSDGRFEKRTVFVADLNLVSGLEVGFGGVWVGAAPHLFFLPDRNDDLAPDGPPEILLDGWGYQDTHETLNAFNWGPDGWLYGCHGVFTYSHVGKPGAPPEERVPLNAAVWRYHPLRHEFEVFAWGTSNPWGVDFDDRGQAFLTACVIPHLFHVIQGARYERQAGAHFHPYVYDDIKTIADHRHYLGSIPHSGNLRSNAAGGGHAHCGAMVYLGGSFPNEYRNSVFMNNIHGNRVNRDQLESAGSGFTGRHAEDFLLANDLWFRGINLKYGPSGSVYLIDWYDERACHDVQPENWDRSNGRIYRISYGKHFPFTVNLPALASEELVRLQLHENDWFVRRARTELQRRGPDARVQALLSELLDIVEEPTKRLRLVWALHAIDGLGAEAGRSLLSDPDEHVRAWTIQLLGERGIPDELMDELNALAATDASPVVRLYLAALLQRIEPDQRWDLAAALLSRGEDAKDPNVPLLLWYGFEPLVPLDAERALAMARTSAIETVRRFAVRRAAAEAFTREALVRAILSEEAEASRGAMVAELVTALESERNVEAPASWPELYRLLSRSSDEELRERALWLAAAFGDSSSFADLRALVADPNAERGRRERALEALVLAKDEESLPMLHAQLADESLRGPVIRALASFGSPASVAPLIANYDSFDGAQKRDVLHTLSSRPGFARALLTAVGEGRIDRKELSAFVIRQLDSLKDDEISGLLATHVGLVRPTAADKATRIAELRASLEENLEGADLPHGRDLFARTCEQCHTLFGNGEDLGPDLTGSNRADLEYLLSNVVDPSAIVGQDYRMTVLWLTDGRTVSGLETQRSATALTLTTENEETTVALDDIEDSHLSELSTMPDGLLDALTEAEIRDLVAYLASPDQVPRLATEENKEQLFDGRTLAGWRGADGLWTVESGELVGRTDGLAQNEFLKKDLELRDFRLTVDVLLKGDQGNSGIQFRSRELAGGDVAGYQADIGPGWWGGLYDEHGRGVLVPAPEPAFLRISDWNTYVISCIGHRVRTWINGFPCADLEDPDGSLSGILALQVHSGGPTEVRFRNFRLELASLLEDDPR